MLTNLYPYQMEGVDFMYGEPKCLNLDDPGLGKTPQAISLIEEVGKKTIVVVRPENLYQWAAEFAKFSTLKVFQITAKSKKAREKQYAQFPNSGADVLLLNYNKVIYDYQQLAAIFSEFEMAIFDEAFTLKAPDSTIHLNFEKLTKRTPRVVALTATPIGATLFDFYNIMRVCHIPNLMDEWTFAQNFLIEGTVACKKGPNNWVRFKVYEGSKNIDLFVELYGKYFLKRTNTAALAEIKPMMHKHPLDLSYDQLDACQELKVAFQTQTIETEKPISTIQVYSKFAQIASSPALVDPERFEDYSPKVAEILAELKSGRRAVVYAKYLGFHTILEKYFKQEGISFVSVSGRVSPKQKDEAKNTFNRGEVQVLLMTGAGKVGLNLQSANHLYLMDPVSTPSEVEQYLGRIYRDGQKAKNVHLHFVYMKDSLEETMLGGLFDTQTVIDEVFDGTKADFFRPLPRRDKLVSFLARDYTHD